jgi:hypothetical protein
MDISSLTPLGFLAPIALFYQQTKHFVVKILRVFWKERTIPSDFARMFYTELHAQSWVFAFDDYKLRKLELYTTGPDMNLTYLFKICNFELFFYKNFIPIFMFGRDGGLKIQYLKFTFPFERFLHVICEKSNHQHAHYVANQRRNSFYILHKRGRSLKEVQRVSELSKEAAPPSPMEGTSNSHEVNLILEPYFFFTNGHRNRIVGGNLEGLSWGPPRSERNKYQLTQVGEKVLNQARKWLEAEPWYSARNIDWKRGFLFHGPPGNGKSSLVLEIGKQLGITLYIFDLSSMDNIEFEHNCDSLLQDPGIVLFEDFDTIFEGRKNLTRTNVGGLTFDCFINKLSGVNALKNKLIFITTNHLDKLDPAVIRDGRMDEIVEVLPLNTDEKRNMAKAILDKWPEKIEQVLTDGAQDSTAAFENRCIRTALASFWA